MNDKKKHFIAGLATAIVVALPVYLESLNLFAGLWSAIVSGILIGCCKEWLDYNASGKWEWPELLCTIGGAVLVAVFIVLMHFAKG